MKKLLSWLKAIWKWIKQANHLWRALSVAILSVAYINLNPDEQSIRITGLILQVLGIFTVAWGIKETRELFGQPSLITKGLQWLKNFPPYGGRVNSGSGHATFRAMTGNSRGCTSLPIDENSSIEDRLAAIETNINHIYKRIHETEISLDKQEKSMIEAISQETLLRELADSETHKKLEASSTGGLHISATGALWLLLGVTMSTAPNELLTLVW
ncbi:hypothetical protein LPB260_25825 [Pseudomonas sp. LPB0260]|uniref:hypothetical protein n=1 Tax=Pseudomonas sp. LPB0260 TaxID=2614442 RepID=UPI0015C1F089|nr:hypothetical protein [Pseudomonas sp. LPB0260]QLC74119.1 hypothetical protein LPB260_10875 [Pseudomonas sp. LPB0260]QLC76890.1 hypothetical protein LPB260_25825 [Pseudomonas sp. LPB0260]